MIEFCSQSISSTKVSRFCKVSNLGHWSAFYAPFERLSFGVVCQLPLFACSGGIILPDGEPATATGRVPAPSAHYELPIPGPIARIAQACS